MPQNHVVKNGQIYSVTELKKMERETGQGAFAGFFSHWLQSKAGGQARVHILLILNKLQDG